MRRGIKSWRWIAPLLLGAIAAALSYLAAGQTLGLFFGGMTMMALIAPPIAAREIDRRAALFCGGCVISGIALVWLIAAGAGSATLGQWLQGCVVLFACGFAVIGAVLALRRLISPTAASAIVVIIAITWLTAPIALAAKFTATCASMHPLLALNRVFVDQGIWTQQRLMYQLTVLGQDVPYALPRSILPCVAIHTLIALSLGWPAWRAATRAEAGS